MDEIDAADIVIADFTLSPANVYFELGYARGKGRRVIQTARRGTVLEFDVRNWRTVFYRNATELEEGRLPAANPRLQRPALRAAAEPPTR
jgi:nucleoside 2-deoxyribosyltransferase